MTVERRVNEASALRAFFKEQLQHLTELLGAYEEGIPVEKADSFPVGEAIDEMVDGTDARIRAVYNYKNHLRSGARVLLEHIDGMVEQLPEAVKLSRQDFVYDPQVSAFLKSIDEVKRLCKESQEVREYIKMSSINGKESFFALLLMNYHEKEIFGHELRGDVIQRDVKQTSVSFTGHRFLVPADNELEVKMALKRFLFENVVEYLKLLLNRKRQSEMQEPIGYNYLNDGVKSLNNPSRYLNKLVSLLELPLDLIHLEENTVRINRMGIKVFSEDKSSDEIHMQNLEIGDGNNKLLVLVEVPFSEDIGNN